MRKRTAIPDSVTNHQKSVRVGPPVLPPRRGSLLRDVRGFLLPAAFFWWLVLFAGTVAEFGAMIYDLSCRDCAFRGHGSGEQF